MPQLGIKPLTFSTTVPESTALPAEVPKPFQNHNTFNTHVFQVFLSKNNVSL